MEPKASLRKIRNLSRRLGFNDFFYDNEVNNHITVMWKTDISMSIWYIDDQILTFRGQHSITNQAFFLSIIYAYCSKHARRRIWDALLNLNCQIKDPWIIGGISMLSLDGMRSKEDVF
uniref:Uncharacterized protein n=1 Tax=Kalanchoe fedtschenkoi TaxID=63787 RepID=A0A7N0UQU2_KALFE